MKAAGALLLAALLAAPAWAQATGEACEVGASVVTCRWEFTSESTDVLASSAQDGLVFELPVFDRTIGVFVVDLLGKDNGWTVVVERQDEAGAWSVGSRSIHTPSQNATGQLTYRFSDESAHVIFTEGFPAHRLRFYFYPETANAAITDVPTVSMGRFAVTYSGQRVPDGSPPSRPAATPEDPHIADIAGDAREPTYDIVAAWFGDERLDDGLIDVHLKLVELQEEIPLIDEVGLGAQAIRWKIAWQVNEERYQVEWIAPDDPDDGAGRTIGRPSHCVLRTERDRVADERDLAHPACTFDIENATLHATFPVLAIGSPRDGETFESPAARTRMVVLGRTEPDVVDAADTASYDFQLGGPEVWSALDGGRKDPPSTPFYADPLAKENLDVSLQIAATLAALTTFLLGFLLVWRRRRQTSGLMARVDEIGARDVDNDETLRALGRLEEEFTLMFRRGRINDSQYQVLTNRIAGVATRFALRRSLGLDDGVPGDAGPTRRVDVGGPADKRLRR